MSFLRAKRRNGDLMLLLTFLLARNSAWRRARVTIMSLATTEMMRDRNEAYLAGLLEEIRINAEIRVLLKDPEETVAETIRRESADAEVVMLGLATPERGEEAEYARRLEAQCEGLPNVFFVKNASLFVGDLVLPDEEAPPEAPPEAAKGMATES